jgi:hypothetical protein
MRIAALPLLVVTAALIAPFGARAETPCTLDNAQPTRIADIVADYHPYRDKCVRLHGVIAFRRFYDSTQSIYRKPDELADPGYIAIYGSESVSRNKLWTLRSGADVAGRISACELIDTTQPSGKNADGSETIVMVIGECHYRESSTIYVSDIKLDDSVPVRLYGLDAARDATLHRLAPADVKPAVRDSARRWFETLRTGDWRKLKAVLGWKFDSRDDELQQATDRKASPFRAALDLARLPSIAYFSDLHEDWHVRSTYGCICTAGDCAGKWPIIQGDTWPDQHWPYACIEIYNNGDIGF